VKHVRLARRAGVGHLFGQFQAGLAWGVGRGFDEGGVGIAAQGADRAGDAAGAGEAGIMHRHAFNAPIADDDVGGLNIHAIDGEVLKRGVNAKGFGFSQQPFGRGGIARGGGAVIAVGVEGLKPRRGPLLIARGGLRARNAPRE